MLSKIKLWFFNHKNSLRMSRILILTVSLLLVTWIFDHQYIAIKSYIPKQLLLSVEVSVDFLSIISGLFLAISTFCFTIIVTILNKYTSSISPRMLQSFIDRTGVLGLYGIFVSGFFYSVISILLLQDIAPDQHVVAGSFGIAYSIIAMLSFIAFSRRVLDNLKVSNIIENVFNDCEKLIDKEVELRKKVKYYEEGDESTNLSIVAESSGYLFEIKSDDIFKELNGIKAEFVINKRIGEYTTKGESVGELNIFQCKLDDNDKKELKEKLMKDFAYNYKAPCYLVCGYNLDEVWRNDLDGDRESGDIDLI